MTFIAAFFAIVCFSVAFQLVRLTDVTANVLETSRKGFAVMKDASLTDAQKEQAVQKASLALFRGFLSILARSAVSVGVSLLIVVLFDFLGLVKSSDVTHLLATWQGIVMAAGIMLSIHFIRTKI